MDRRYDMYCVADPLFYDSPAEFDADVVRLAPAHRPAPGDWSRREQGWWLVLTPVDAKLPLQGWKIHVSARLDNADEVLETVWDFCVQRRIAFKFLRTRFLLAAQNAKYAPRGSSGKFITIYPMGEEELRQTLLDLGSALAGQPGPYILSDLRWGAGPLYVRYGGFAERYCPSEETGEAVLAVEDPRGILVPDPRDPVFQVPRWVRMPSFLAEQAAAGDSEPPRDFPYRIEEAMHFSNGGGVYRAVAVPTGRQVVLKEARPWAGIDWQGTDAVARLERERAALERLSGLDVVPELIDYRICWEHHFLVQEYLEGEPLNRLFGVRYPLIHPDPTADEIRSYANWALDMTERLERAVDAVHARGVVFGDLHPANILVRPDGDVTFVDFEIASRVEEEYRRGLFAPGFGAPGDLKGFEVDRYALACLRLFLFVPLTMLLPLDQGKMESLVRAATERFPLPDSFADQVLGELQPRSSPPTFPRPGAHAHSGSAVRLDSAAPDWNLLCKSIVEGILASATLERPDRLFPGDIAQFTYGGAGVAYGAAGVLYVLSAAGTRRYPQHEEWLLDRVRKADSPRVGFYDGLHGIAYVLEHLGRRDAAEAVLARALAVVDQVRNIGVFEGLAGIGLNLLHFAKITAERPLLDSAFRVADRLASALEGDDLDTDKASRLPAGLLHGFSGPALFFIRLYEKTGDDRFLDLAARGLRRDLASCRTVADGSVQVDEGWRVLPYIEVGSAGIGLVLHEYLRHRTDEQFVTAQAGIRLAAQIEFAVYPSLFDGRAGLMAYLLHVDGATQGTSRNPAVDRHLRRLLWHALSYQGYVAFPGRELLRLSMDLATGSAGILLVLRAALDGNGVALPFLSPQPLASRHDQELEGGDKGCRTY